MENIVVVGGGPGGAALLRILLNTPNISIVGLADLDTRSPGMDLARRHNIYTTTDYRELIQRPGRKIVFNATGAPKVEQELLKLSSKENLILEPGVTKLIWELVDSIIENNEAILKETTVLLTSISQGINNMTELNQAHSITITNTMEEANSLTKTTETSQALLEETKGIVQIIERVAQQSKMLGLNAAIEAARAGEHGRGFSVVADSIHGLAENSVASVQNVTGTINNVHETLQDISAGVEMMVASIGKMEKHYNHLIQDLGLSFEQMSSSVKDLNSLIGE